MQITLSDLAEVVDGIESQEQLTMLHIGCGSASPKRLPECFKDERWQEVKLDINAAACPDIVADVCDMAVIDDDSYDAVWSSHSLEHISDCYTATALEEIHRVLRPGGFLLATMPDLGSIAQMVVDGRLHEVIYESPAGPIRPIDMLFGHQRAIARGNPHMAHRTGFTVQSLFDALESAGFVNVHVRPGAHYDLWAIAVK